MKNAVWHIADGVSAEGISHIADGRCPERLRYQTIGHRPSAICTNPAICHQPYAFSDLDSHSSDVV